MNKRCEYLVIGTGAGGSVAGALLAEAGRDVLFIEEGDDSRTHTSANVSEWMRHTYRNGGVFPFLGSPIIPFAEACTVGGGTVINGALIWRTPPWILEEWREQYGLEGYDEAHLKPHFETVERDLHVVEHRLDEQGNRDSLALYQGAQKLGWRTAMAPRAIKLDAQGEHKQSTLENYIPRALTRGARMVTNCRAVKVVHENGRARRIIARSASHPHPSSITVDFDQLVLATGAVQTPHLLQRSGITHKNGYEVQFHMNLKIVALYPDQLNAHQGTIFTVQVQEFMQEGILMMATYLTPHFLALTLARHGNDAVNYGLNQYFHTAVFTAMVRAKSRARILSRLGGGPLVWYRLDPEDISKIKLAIRRMAEVLFQSGAVTLYLPIKESEPVKSLQEVDQYLEKVQPKLFDIAIMHVMASCPMGPSAESSVVRPDGRLWNSKNIIMADASILPSNIGESPQGTIMAFVHEIMGRHLNG